MDDYDEQGPFLRRIDFTIREQLKKLVDIEDILVRWDRTRRAEKKLEKDRSHLLSEVVKAAVSVLIREGLKDRTTEEDIYVVESMDDLKELLLGFKAEKEKEEGK